jgi:taurine dioxygenase
MHYENLHPYFGVRISGIESDNLNISSTVDQIKQSVHEHGFVLLKGLELNPDSIMSLANSLGEPELGYRPEFTHRDHPELVLLGNMGNVEEGTTYLNTQGIEWHTDATGKGLTPGVTMLYCLKTPVNAGDTLFASTDSSYAEMNREQLEIYRDMKVVHSFNVHNDKVAEFAGTNVNIQQGKIRERYPDFTDAVVKTHPNTGRPCFFISHQLVKEVVDYNYDEGMALVMNLVNHITQPRFVFRQKWQAGDLVIFDNRSCLHSATEYDYENQDRYFFQIIIAGFDE